MPPPQHARKPTGVHVPPPDGPTVRFVGVGEVPQEVTVVIEVSRGSFVKRRPGGRIELISLLPCPYDYGSVPDTLAPDGDPLDAVVLGTRTPVGAIVRARVQAVMGFVDAGAADPKLICADAPLTPGQARGIERFFGAYAWFKRAVHGLRRGRGPTHRVGWLHRVE